MKIIYSRTNLINGKKYIGQTTDILRRERDWKKLNTSYSNKEINEDRKTYGFENFKLEIIEICEDEEADEKERYYIEKYNTLFPNGYNKYSGGIRDFTFTANEETKKKISITTKGTKKTEETKKKISEGLRNHPDKSKQIYQYSLNNELIAVWPSAKEAARTLHFSQGNISNCCNGGFYSKQRNKWVNRIQYNGYKWSYEPL